MKIDIIVGSMLGASEYVAEALETSLKQRGHQVTCHLNPNSQEIEVSNFWIIVTSTHGAGDLPDNILAFADDIKKMDLERTKVLIIGLGDSSYDTFCHGCRTMENRIVESKGTLVAPVFEIDVLHHPIPEDIALEWLEQNLDKIQ